MVLWVWEVQVGVGRMGELQEILLCLHPSDCQEYSLMVLMDEALEVRPAGELVPVTLLKRHLRFDSGLSVLVTWLLQVRC